MLEDATSKLASVVTAVRGRWARAIVQRLRAGETDAAALAEVARGRLRAKRDARAQAVGGRLQAHPVFPARANSSLTSTSWMRPSRGWTLNSPCAGPRSGRPSRGSRPFPGSPGARRKCSSPRSAPISRASPRRSIWLPGPGCARGTQGNAESGGRRLRGRTRRGTPWLRRTLAEVANGAGRTKGTYLAAQFRRIAARRGKARAIVAVGHSVLVALYHMLTRHESYRDLGAQSFDAHARDHVQRRRVQRLERLGFVVTLEALPATSG